MVLARFCTRFMLKSILLPAWSLTLSLVYESRVMYLLVSNYVVLKSCFWAVTWIFDNYWNDYLPSWLTCETWVSSIWFCLWWSKLQFVSLEASMWDVRAVWHRQRWRSHYYSFQFLEPVLWPQCTLYCLSFPPKMNILSKRQLTRNFISKLHSAVKYGPVASKLDDKPTLNCST